MKRVSLCLSLLLVLLANLHVFSQAQKSTDEAAIRQTVTNYIESYYTANGTRMEQTLHPHYLKHVISDSDDGTRMTEKTGLQMVQDVRSGQPIPAADRGEQVSVLNISGDIASAKLVTPHWVDYLTLSKWNGDWKIVSVVQRETE